MSPVIDGGSPSGTPATPSGLTSVQEILLVAQQQLQDTTGLKWGSDVTLPYLNLGIKEIINLCPEAYPVTKNLQMVAGSIQNLTTEIAVIDVICNLTGTTDAVGLAINSLDKQKMDSILPGWMTFTASDTVLSVILDSRTPKTFYVFPPQPASPKKIKAVVSEFPAAITEPDVSFPLDDSYRPAIIDYLIYRALAEETTIPNALQKSQMFYKQFLQDLGIKQAVEQQNQQKGK